MVCQLYCGYFEYILSLYKKEEFITQMLYGFAYYYFGCIDYLKDPVWEEVGYSI